MLRTWARRILVWSQTLLRHRPRLCRKFRRSAAILALVSVHADSSGAAMLSAIGRLTDSPAGFAGGDDEW